MSTPRYLEHLTITSGDSRRCWREEVADEILDMLRPLIDRAIETGRHVPLPDVVSPRSTITASQGRARALLVTVWGPALPQGSFSGIATSKGGRVQVHPAPPIPLVTLGVAPTSLASAELWRKMVPGGGEEQLPQPPAPSVPWVAVRLHETATLWPEALSWLGDFERCLAWAWVRS